MIARSEVNMRKLRKAVNEPVMHHVSYAREGIAAANKCEESVGSVQWPL